MSTTLAGDYVIRISRDSTSWDLFPIEDVVAGSGILAEGAQAKASLSDALSTSSSLQPVATISNTWRENDHNEQSHSVDSQLLEVLDCVFAQWAWSSVASANEPPSSASPTTSKLQFAGQSLSVDLTSESGFKALFSDFHLDGDDVEWVEMVTGSGQVLGQVPRPLVHKYNLLHRGIGLFVTKDRPMNEQNPPPLYTHRRSSTKRIFPSLYDMFVGGVSLAGEPAELTARREVAEELGLSRALDEDTDAWLGPLLTCTVCTAYNRCVVTLFSYTMRSDEETVTWQEEEVDWGRFVPYPVIVAAADRSIERFAQSQTWPGTYPPIQSPLGGALPEGTVEDDDTWKEWDFVPDGLLVWEAWLQYLRRRL